MKKDISQTLEIMTKIGEAYKKANELTRQSLWLEQMGIKPKCKPIVSNQEMSEIDWLIQETRQGFQLTQKITNNPKKQLKELSKFNIEDDVISQTRLMMGLCTVSDKAPEVKWLAFQQFKITINTLLQAKSFSYADLPDVNNDVNLGLQEMTVSYWNHSNDPEFMWSLINTMQKVISMSSQGEIKHPHQVLKIGHFCAQANYLVNSELQ